MAFTTAASPSVQGFSANRALQITLAVCAVVWVWAAIDPVYRFDWFLENILVAVGVGLFAWLHRTRPLSDLSHLLLAVFFCMHVAASHYTYSETPWGDWLKDALDTDRNHYDRIVHFSFGLLLAYPVREYLVRHVRFSGFSSFFFAFVVLVACSEVYEIIEWLVAAIVDPEAGTAFLGTQGDPFDAQKDTALALLGTVLTLCATALFERRCHVNNR
ncbi:MAG: DUF2238 domain-containing protein [Rhodospirillaceae bacterium]|nr:DUF2238 domain-containing protein [Rhodospirillaceae bacterium]